jgi:tetratricopeptide (TPR) repeat protein
MTALLALGALSAPVLATGQQTTPGQADGPLTESPQYNKKNQPPSNQKIPANGAPSRSENESSSEQTRMDLSSPEADVRAHPDGGHVADDALGLKHEWNPLKSMKDIEVGDYYYREGNYKAAVNRYREALDYKPRDAVATFKLAQTLEKLKALDEAKLRYEEYLTILKDGPSAAEARKALARLKSE